MNISKTYKSIKKEILMLRRTIHKNPELAFEEFKTADTICSFLDKYSISYKNNIAKTGILAEIGNDNGKVVMIRADMDALPIDENTNLEFTSVNKGKMHACGHDIHIASALAAAYILKQHEKELCGKVKFVFQPAEETTGGALPMIEQGIMENPHVDAVIGGHVTPALKSGKIWVKSGALMASPDDFCITFVGKSTHGAEPENGINPITPAAEFVCEINKAFEKEITDNEKNVLSICTLSGGNSINIIPDTAMVIGTFRSFCEQTRQKASLIIKKLAAQKAEKYGTEFEYKYNFLYPPVINDDKITEMITSSATKVIGSENIIKLEKPMMTGEDFSYYGKNAPSSFIWYGCGLSENEPPLHSSEFVADENSIEIATKIFCEFVCDYFNMKQ